MHKSRIEAFSDGVLAIIITIMVLELKMPSGHELSDLVALVPVFGSYVMSFIFVGIYWNNHHHLFQAVQKVSGGVLWANMHLLFWLSLIPAATAWMGESQMAPAPVMLYGIDLLLSGVAYFILTRTLLRANGKNSALARAIGSDFKGMLSVILYVLGILVTFASPAAAVVVYTLVAVIWFIPDRRIERTLKES